MKVHKKSNNRKLRILVLLGQRLLSQTDQIAGNAKPKLQKEQSEWLFTLTKK